MKSVLSGLLLLLSALCSIAVGVLGIILFHEQPHEAELALIVGELLNVLTLPVWLYDPRFSLAVIASGQVMALVAGILMIDSVSELTTTNISRVAVRLFIANAFLGGVAIGNLLQCTSHTTTPIFDEESEKSSVKSKKVISLKASAATLVDVPKEPVLQRQMGVDYSIKKLSVINQSSSTNISHMTLPRDNSHNTIKSYQPMIIGRDMETSPSMLRERDAIRRIPSVLLPPHLRPQPSVIKTHSMTEMSNHMVQSIPRASTLAAIPHFTGDGPMKTMTLEDYERNYEEILHHEIHASSFHPQTKLYKQESDDSTEDALRFIEDANDTDLASAMAQTASDLNLERMRTPSPPVTRRSSIFGHSRMSSSLSFKGSPSKTSPSKASPGTSSKKPSPRKLRLQTLSLSSVVYKEETPTPDFSYVHELQSSPQKTRTPQKALEIAPKGTPESNNSDRSVFPSDAIGEYDKEKWKTMRRLELV